jgi:phage terminase large subunit GpA-like protein
VEDRGDLEDEDSLLARREEYPAELPDGVLVLTCGVDTQDDRLEYEVVGFGHFGENWGIKKGIIMGRPDDADVWAKLDDVIEHVYRFADGSGLRISMTFVDEAAILRRTCACNAGLGSAKRCSPSRALR